MRHRTITAVFLGVCVFSGSHVQATVLETNDWDDLTQTGWNITASTPIIDAAPAGGSSPSGGSALRFAYAAGTYPTSFSAGRASFSQLNGITEFYMGHWNKYSSGFVFNGNGTKMDFLILQDPGAFNFTGNMATGWKGDSSTPTSVASNQIVWGPGTHDFYSTYTLTTPTTWHWIEHHYKINTPGQSDGIYQMWVDDVLVNNQTTVPYRDASVTTGWGREVLTAEWGGGGGIIPATQYWWVDHSVFSTTRIGRPGSSPVSDTTPPSPPVGLKFQ